MLKQSQICAIRKVMFLRKKSITKLAEEFDVSRTYLSMVLNGSLNNADIENKVIKWYKTEKDNIEQEKKKQ